MRWSGGGPLGIAATIELREQRLRDGAAEIVRITVDEAEIAQRARIEAAHTETGYRRVSSEGRSSAYGSTSPGRIDSGLMINATNTRTTVHDGVISGRWGWFDPEDYFDFQDWGTKDIEGAHSLFESYIHARGRLAKRMNTLVRTGQVT